MELLELGGRDRPCRIRVYDRADPRMQRRVLRSDTSTSLPSGLLDSSLYSVLDRSTMMV